MQSQRWHPGRPLLTLLMLLWSGVVGAGYFALSKYASAPGRAGESPGQWPEASSLARSGRGFTLLMFAHPKCPCTRASIGELARILAECQDRLQAYVLFYKPRATGPEWERTDLWHAAEMIPGVRAVADVDLREARRFGAETSGDVLVYDAAGQLRFHGGITAARGHSGDSLGHSAIVTLARTGQSDLEGTPVLGCLLSEQTEGPNRE
jgi:hypothetical protein